MLGNKKPFLSVQIWHNAFCYFPYVMSFLFCLHVLKTEHVFPGYTVFIWSSIVLFQHFKDSILLSSVLNLSDQNLCFTFCLIIYIFFSFCCFDTIFHPFSEILSSCPFIPFSFCSFYLGFCEVSCICVFRIAIHFQQKI